MSSLKRKIGNQEVFFDSPPRGNSGSVNIQVGKVEPGSWQEVRWMSDQQGIWIETEKGTFGFDVIAQQDDEGEQTFRLKQRNSENLWESVKYLRGSSSQVVGAASGKKKVARIRAQMPGKIVKLKVSPGDHVEKDQPLLVMEAMKMENEIKAPQAGTVKSMAVSEGQTVESGAELLILDSSNE